jgi:hypothetical protein
MKNWFTVLFIFLLQNPLLSVQWNSIDWQIVKGEHFDIYFPKKYNQLAESTLVISENANIQLARVLNHNLSEVISIFVYPSSTSFQNTNLLPVPLDEGTGGFTEAGLKRIAIPFTGSYNDFNRVLVHELVHAYQYDMVKQGSGLGRLFQSRGFLPLWFAEGLAEYLSIGLDSSYKTVIQDAIFSELLPSLSELDRMQVANGYLFYKAGQSVCYYIAKTYGEQVLGEMILAYARLRSTSKVIRATLGISLEELDQNWKIYTKRQFIDTINKKSSNETGKLLTRHRENLSLINLSPVINKDGSRVYYLSARKNSIAIIKRDIKKRSTDQDFEVFDRKPQSEIFDEEVLWSVRNDDLVTDVNLLSNRLSLSADDRYLLLSATANGKEVLMLFDIKEDSMETIFESNFEVIKHPYLNKEGTMVTFVASRLAQSDIFIYNLDSKRLLQVTSTLESEAFPIFSSNDKEILFAAEQSSDSQDMDIKSVIISSRKTATIIEAAGHQYSPYLSKDDKLYFLSKHQGTGNLFVFDKKSGALAQLTDSAHSIDYFYLNEEGFMAMQIYRALGFDLLNFPLGQALKEAQSVDINWKSSVEGPKYQDLSVIIDPIPTGLTAPIRPSFDYFLLGFQYSDLYGVGGFLTTMASDQTGNHSVVGYLDYSGISDALNFEAAYTNRKSRAGYTIGGYRRTNQFSIFNLADLTSINNFLYTPGYLSAIYQTGIYGNILFPLTKYWSLGSRLEIAREEQEYFSSSPFGNQLEDIATNLQTFSVYLQRNSSLLSLYGPIDGTYLGLFYSTTADFSGNDYKFQRLDLDIRNYITWNNRLTLASRFSLSSVLGRDKNRIPLYLGGYNSIRGYPLFSVRGLNRIISNVELRFPLVEAIIMGLPVPWLLRGFQGVAFIDAGAAFDNWSFFKGVDSGRTRDLLLSYGLGFRYVLSPGLNIRIDWATPYDLVSSLPVSRWQGTFSLGYAY